MRHTSRRLFMPSMVTLVVLLGMILAACGGTTTTPTAPAGGEATQPPVATQPTGAEATPTTEAVAETPAGTAEGKILRIHQPVYPDVIDPQKSSFSNEIAVLSMNYEGLTKLNAELETVPGAAENWEYNEDATVLTFTLRPDLKYSDGSPLTAQNYEYALLRTAHPETAGEYQSIIFDIAGAEELASTSVTDTEGLQQAIENFGVEAVDERTLVIRLNSPAPYFHTVMSLWVTYPVKQEVVEAAGENWWQDAANHIGNGPFQMTSIQPNQLISFEANENYYEGRPVLDGLEYVYIEDSSVALEAYRAGQIDIMQPDPSQLPAIRGDAELNEQLLSYPSASTFNLSFNLTKEPFTDKKVREAFSYAFDRETYCSEIRNGDCLPTLSWIPDGIPGAIETDQYAYDPDAARQALAESSYGGPEGLPPIKFTYPSSDPANRPRAEWIAQSLGEVLGIQIELEPVESTTLVQLRKSPETYPQMLISGWIQDYPDPQNWLSVYWTCDATFAQRFAYCNEQFDELVRQGDTSLDPEERIRFYEEAGQLLVDDVPGPFLYNLANVYLVKPYVTGYETTASDSEWPGQWASLLTVDVNR
ncbi:MAG: ABC transporter substrate-binding protein [Herpetosiphonaceae bacterium]|nr:MAG: ABC transporter substrate-binding protein [Herpetosiphonaceae bacterium]